MSALAGTGNLIQLALRRDRLILPSWIVLLSVLPASGASAFEQLYPSAAQRAGLTASMGSNPSIAVLYGPAFDLSTAGGFVAWRFSGFLAVFVGIMAIFTVTRHTRAEEDTGRGELLGSAVIGRYAMLTAAVTVSCGAGVLIGLIQAGTLVATGVPAAGAFALGASTTGAGLVFTGLAAVCVQIAEYSRTANGFGTAILGATFLLRGVGDSTAEASWLSWLSPIGWTQQVRAFTGERWWVLAIPVVVAVLLGGIGYALLPRRDVGMGLIAAKPGPSRAASGLASSLALSWRLHRASLLGWVLGMAVAGVLLGSIAEGVGSLIGGSEQARQIFERMGGSSGIIDTYLATMTGMFGMIAALYGVQATLRMRTEETSVRVDPLLATRVGRLGWIASHLVFAFLGTALITVVAGTATGLAHGLRSQHVAGAVGDVLRGTAAQLPATWVVLAVAVALFGIWPRIAIAAWGVVLGVLLIGLLGPMLQLPQTVLDISPFTHIPKIPGAEFTATPLIWLSAIAVVVAGAGVLAFRRRDID